jgi:hypothetical protein
VQCGIILYVTNVKLFADNDEAFYGTSFYSQLYVYQKFQAIPLSLRKKIPFAALFAETTGFEIDYFSK